MPPLPPDSLIAKLYTEAIAQGDRIGPITTVNVDTARTPKGCWIFTSVFLDCALPDGIPGERIVLKEHVVVSIDRKVDGWPVTSRLWFRDPALRSQIADAEASEIIDPSPYVPPPTLAELREP